MQENFKRVLFPGVRYSFPEKQDKADPSDKAALRARLAAYGGGDFAEFLFSNLSGLALPTCRILVRELFGDVPPRADSSDTAERIYDFIFSEEKRPAVERDARGAAKDFHARFAGGQPCPSVNAAQDICYTERESAREFSERQRKLESLLAARRKKEEKKLALLCERELSCADMEKNRVFGELITANIYALKKGMEGCELVNYYDEGAAKVKIPLDRTLTPAQNAQKYYKKYNKQKRTLEAVSEQKREAEADLDYTRSMLSSLSRAENALDLSEIADELRGAGILPPEKKRGAKQAAVPSAPLSSENSPCMPAATTCRTTGFCAPPRPTTSGCTPRNTTVRTCSSAREGASCPKTYCWRRRRSARIFRMRRRAAKSLSTTASAALSKNLRARGRDSSPTPTSKPFSSSPAATPMRNRHDFQIAPPMR